MSIIYKVLMLVGVAFSAWARPPIDINQDIIISDAGVDAKQEAFKKAVEDATLKLISETVGSDALEKHSAKIKQILERSEKYVLFIKGSNAEPVPTGTKIRVDMKISLDNLEALLRQAGLLQASRAAKLLPLIEWSDDASDSHFAWWVTPKNGVKLETTRAWQKFQTTLAIRMKARGVHLVTDLSLEKIPPALRKHSLTREEQLEIAKLFEATLILTGEIKGVTAPGANKAQVQTELVEAKAERTVTTGQFAVGPLKEMDLVAGKTADMIGDLVKSAQGEGSLNLATFKLSIQGDLSFVTLEQLRHELMDHVLDIHSLKDRMYAPGLVTLEGESNRSVAELVLQIRQVRFSVGKITAEESGTGEITLHFGAT